MTAIHSRVLRFSQWLNRRFNSAYRESLYQSSYLDLARRTDWLLDVPLASPDGGTASFSFLYVLLSILRERCVSNILELGVGRSTKLLIQYGRTFNKSLTLVDQDESWLRRVTPEAPNVKTIHAPLLKCHVAGKLIRWYGCNRPLERFDLMLIDGPTAFSHADRFNRLGVLSWLPEIAADQFLMIVDDSTRPGEALLVRNIMNVFAAEGWKVGRKEFLGAASQTLLMTPRFHDFRYL